MSLSSANRNVLFCKGVTILVRHCALRPRAHVAPKDPLGGVAVLEERPDCNGGEEDGENDANDCSG